VPGGAEKPVQLTTVWYCWKMAVRSATVAEQMSAVMVEMGTLSEEMWDSWVCLARVLGFVERRSTVMVVVVMGN
jgi:hypothetical protein